MSFPRRRLLGAGFALCAGRAWCGSARDGTPTVREAVTAHPITALAYSPDGGTLLAGGYRSVSLTRPGTGGVARTLRCDLEQIHDLAFDPAGVRLAVAGGAPGAEGHVLLFTWPQLVPAGRVVGHRDVITSVAFSPSGVELATGGFDRVTRVTPVGPGAVPAAARVTLSGHAGPVLAAGWTPGAQTLVTAGGDRSLKVWSAEDGGLVRSLNNHTDAVNCLAFRPARGAGARSPYCATGSDDRTARVWQPELGRMVRIIRGAPAPVLAVAYSRDGSTLFTAGAEGVVRAVDGESDEIKHAWPAVDGWIYSLAVRPDGRELAAAGSMGKVFRLAVDPA